MKTSGDHAIPLDDRSASARDAAAARRDRAAEDRDFAAAVRDGVAAVGRANPPSEEERLAAHDRAESARDRRHSARDRESASHDLANEGIDFLTGVLGRRVGYAAVQREMDRSERTGESLILAFVDTVGLKAINDADGHAAGDRALQDIAGCIRSDLRSYDLVTRVGGDEFVCTFTGQNLAEAGRRYEEISRALDECDNGARMTVGLASRRDGDSLEQLVDRADQAMLGTRRSQDPASPSASAPTD